MSTPGHHAPADSEVPGKGRIFSCNLVVASRGGIIGDKVRCTFKVHLALLNDCVDLVCHVI